MQQYGRVDGQTAELFKRLAEQVRDEVVPALGSGASDEMQAFTLEAVLGTALRDWRENGNTAGLLPQDVEDLRGFVKLAKDSSGPPPHGYPIFQAALQGLLEDWLQNWNADGVPGPPQRS